jgi:hypothetical protein
VRCVRCAVCSVQMCAVLAAGRGEVNNGLPGMQRKVVLAMRRLYYMYLPHWQWRWRRRCETSRWSQEPADQRRLTTLRLVKVCGGSSNIQCTNGGGRGDRSTHTAQAACRLRAPVVIWLAFARPRYASQHGGQRSGTLEPARTPTHGRPECNVAG